MLKVIDKTTGDELAYEDIEDFRETSKRSFDESVHDVIDDLCDCYKRHVYIGNYESYLGIEIA